MKVLLINEKYKQGGTEVQTLREKSILEERGHQVFYITFDSKVTEGYVTANHYNIPLNQNKFVDLFNKSFCNVFLKNKILSLVHKFSPDVIHLQNINCAAFTILSVCKEYKTFQTIRDYSAVCPKSTCIRDNYAICSGYVCQECRKCKLTLKQYLKLLRIRRINGLRKKTVHKFFCPSKELTEYCIDAGLDTVCINNPFDFEKYGVYANHKTPNQIKTLLFYGSINKTKGLDLFISALQKSGILRFKLIICGKVEQDMADYMNGLNSSQIEYLGVKEYDEMLEIVSLCDAVVVPSLWLENYPNTLLEAMALGKVAIASNRGGMKSMLNNSNLIFDVLNEDDIIEKLYYLERMDSSTYDDIVANNRQYLMKNNTFDIFYERLINQICSS